MAIFRLHEPPKNKKLSKKIVLQCKYKCLIKILLSEGFTE